MSGARSEAWQDLPREFDSLRARAWLNTAHQGALPGRAAAAAREAIAWKLSPWEMTTERFSGVPEALRSRLARLLAVPTEEIVLANSSSQGLHLLANGFPWRAGDQVLLVRGDFPSTILPWLGLRARGVEVRFVEPRGAAVTADEVEAHLGPRTRLFCTTWVHSFTGHVIDERGIGERCRARGVRFVLNASQGIGSRPLAPAGLPVDAVTSVGFKWLCGPYGTGFCWLRDDLLAGLEYNQAYWLAFQTAVGLETPGEPDLSRDVGARRYDLFGTANFFNFAAWTASLDLVLELGPEAIAARDQRLVDRFVAELPEDRVELLSPRAGHERSPLVFVSHRTRANRDVLERLHAAGVEAALRRGQLRFSPHFYNTTREIDRALEVLGE